MSSTFFEKKKNKKRMDKFEANCSELIDQGYRRRDILFSERADIWKGILYVLPVILVQAFTFPLLVQDEHRFSALWKLILFVAVGYLVLVLVHELIHGLFWGMFAKNHFKDVEFGVSKGGNPYCYCGSALTTGQYLLGALMPTVILGIGTWIAAIVMKNFQMLLLSMLIIGGGAGDMVVVKSILSLDMEDKEILCCDHPNELGLVVFEKDMRNEKGTR